MSTIRTALLVLGFLGAFSWSDPTAADEPKEKEPGGRANGTLETPAFRRRDLDGREHEELARMGCRCGRCWCCVSPIPSRVA